jgi:hypothetical protein
MLVTRRLGIDAPILVLLTVPCAGVPIMKSNGKSQGRMSRSGGGNVYSRWNEKDVGTDH